jgi:hypothetical protein
MLIKKSFNVLLSISDLDLVLGFFDSFIFFKNKKNTEKQKQKIGKMEKTKDTVTEKRYLK